MSRLEPGPRAHIPVLLAALALAVTAGLGGRSAIEAATPPASFYGTAGPGDIIEARFNGVVCASATVGADGFWSFQVPSGGACGVSEGGALAFFRNGANTGSVETFKSGGVPASISGGVNVGAGPLAAPAPPSIAATPAFVGAVPGPGGTALLVTGQDASPDFLKIALRGAGCDLQMLGVLRTGAWAVYIEGAPTAVNSAFPASLPRTTAFFVRC